MSDLLEYHIRRKCSDENGYRKEFGLADKLLTIVCDWNDQLEVIKDLDYNLNFKNKGKLCISQENGYLQIYFEGDKFSELETEILVDGLKKSLEGYFEEDLDCFKSSY